MREAGTGEYKVVGLDYGTLSAFIESHPNHSFCAMVAMSDNCEVRIGNGEAMIEASWQVVGYNDPETIKELEVLVEVLRECPPENIAHLPA